MSVEHDDQPGADGADGAMVRRPRWWVSLMSGVALIAFVWLVAVTSDNTDTPQSTPDTATSRPAPGPTFPGEMASDPTSQAELVATLRSLLPEGTVTEANEHELAPDVRSNAARIIYDDGNGPAGIRISFSWLESGAQTELTIECQPVLPTEYGDCIGPVKLPDGSRVSLTQGYADINRRVDTKQWLAQLSTKSGYYISITEWNAVDRVGAPVTRDEPPLSQEQLKKLITADVWRRVAPRFSEISMPPDPSVKDVLDIAVQLLPEGLDVIGKGTEYPYLTVDDGKGITTVQINVHFDAFKTGPEAYPKDDETRVPPEGPGDKGVEGSVMWTAETKLENNLHIVISAFNPSSHGVPTRPAPALTMKQLREIALSSEWNELVA